MPGKLILWPKHRCIRSNEGISLATNYFWWNWLAFHRRQGRLVVEEFQLTWGSGHKQLNDRLGLPRKVRRADRQGVDHRAGRSCSAKGTGKQAGQSDFPNTDAALFKE